MHFHNIITFDDLVLKHFSVKCKDYVWRTYIGRK